MFKWFGIVNHVPHTKVGNFADELRAGRLTASRCRACGHTSFPPRADCERCLSPEFELTPIDGRGRLWTWTRISAAPSGFESLAPYVLGVVELDAGGRALAPLGASLAFDALRIEQRVRLVPRLHEEREEIRVDYTIEADEPAARPPA